MKLNFFFKLKNWNLKKWKIEIEKQNWKIEKKFEKIEKKNRKIEILKIIEKLKKNSIKFFFFFFSNFAESNPCELSCRPQQHAPALVYTFGKVEDGTPCSVSGHFCVNGRCLVSLNHKAHPSPITIESTKLFDLLFINLINIVILF